MTEKTTYLTREGRAKLEAELEELTTVERKHVAERIAAAKELGDISESGEYEDAKSEQSYVEGRIRELEMWLSHAQVIQNGTGDKNTVRIGTLSANLMV